MINILKWPFRKFRWLWHLYKSNPCNLGVVQIFLHDEQRNTCYALTNFPSFLLPKLIGKIWYEISLFDEKGQLVFSKDIPLAKFGSAKITPAEYCQGRIPTRGLFQANLKVSRLGLMNKYYLQLLGKLTAHFYALFYSKDYGSLAMIHPQTVAPVADSDEKSNFWYSQYLIPTLSVTKLEVFQINPCKSSYNLNLKLFNTTGEVIAESTEDVPGFGSRKIMWDRSTFEGNEYLYLASDTLRGNEKPIVFSYYADGSFTAIHT